MLPISYKILADAIDFYHRLGYGYIEVPWTARRRAMEITTPKDAPLFEHRGEYLVASGEQSFLHMLQDGTLKPGKHLCVTPCFRGEKEYNEYTRPYFMKVELIVAGADDRESVQKVLADAARFFNRYLPEPVLLKSTDIGTDIMYDGIELGSYGARNDGTTGPWVYGTGVAEPRFSRMLSKIPKGYGLAPIPRGKFGEFSKIREELEELRDAMDQKVSIMSQVELADLYGSIEGFLKKEFPWLTMEDLRLMNERTKAAFENGYRK